MDLASPAVSGTSVYANGLKNVPAVHTVCISQPGTEMIYGERKHILFLSVESTGTFIKTFIFEVPHIRICFIF